MTIRRRGALIVPLILITLGACAPADDSTATFATLAGSVTANPDDEVVINLVLVAPSGSPVWDGISELVVANHAPDGGDIVFVGDSIPLEPGTTDGGFRVGSIAVPLDADVDEFRLREVTITIAGEDEPTTHAVGDWTMTRSTSDPVVAPTGEYPASIGACGPMAVDVEPIGAAEPEVTGLDVAGDGLAAESVEIEPAPNGATRVSFDLVCDGDADLAMFSPLLTIEAGGERITQGLDSILAGYLDLSREDVERIWSR